MSPRGAVGLAGHAEVGSGESLEASVADRLATAGAGLPAALMGAGLGLVDDLEEQPLLGDARPKPVTLEAGEITLGAALVLAGSHIGRRVFGVEFVVAGDQRGDRRLGL